MQTPATITRIHFASVLSPKISEETGIANIATPTPNHPICVKLIIAEDR